MIKTLLVLLPIVLVCSCASKSKRETAKNGIIPEISAPQTLQLQGETYEAAYSSIQKDGGCVVEYYRAGEDRKTWVKALALRLDISGPDSLQMVDRIQKAMDAAQASAVRSFKDKTAGGCGIEFTIMSQKFVELGVFRFVNRTNGPGTISLQYTGKISAQQLRAVGEARLPAYYANIRSNVVSAMIATPMPRIERVAK